MAMAGIQQAMAGLAGCGGTAAELSAFLRGVRDGGGGGSLRQLGVLSRDAEKLLFLDVLKARPLQRGRKGWPGSVEGGPGHRRVFSGRPGHLERENGCVVERGQSPRITRRWEKYGFSRNEDGV